MYQIVVLKYKPIQNLYFAVVEVVEVNLINPFDSVSFCISHSNSPALMIMAAIIGNSVSNFLKNVLWLFAFCPRQTKRDRRK
ncbi:hypothetical protein [aff. Roholtiella sp. LEGE 12411]|uniref:hypothetical protein n=1 Tax=aff. Roholtiella sp. LEGE 12411 TaxID=1828822 RepID=UPI00187F8DC1|nr:hypothetical protein [aff. Roholtiella sp. LEGE 12411]MBE9037895.1 hypothetical protein [aff. Roholtiella sp. LEGE 12411]